VHWSLINQNTGTQRRQYSRRKQGNETETTRATNAESRRIRGQTRQTERDDADGHKRTAEPNRRNDAKSKETQHEGDQRRTPRQQQADFTEDRTEQVRTDGGAEHRGQVGDVREAESTAQQPTEASQHRVAQRAPAGVESRDNTEAEDRSSHAAKEARTERQPRDTERSRGKERVCGQNASNTAERTQDVRTDTEKGNRAQRG